jgi:diamine N-acetyltransferase
MRIEPVGLPQLELLHHIIPAIYLQHFRHYWTDAGAYYTQLISKRETLEKYLQDPTHRYFLAYSDEGEIAGFLKLIFDCPVMETDLAPAVLLDKLYLDAKYQGQGIGKALIAFSRQQALAADAQWLWLRVMEKNPESERIYAKAGFRRLFTHTLDLPFLLDDHRLIRTMIWQIG